MATTLKVLRSFSITANVATELNNGGSTKGWLIKSVCFFNASSSAATFDLYAKLAGGANTYIYKGFSIPVGDQVFIGSEIGLNHVGTADTLNVLSTQALSCVMQGLERDQS